MPGHRRALLGLALPLLFLVAALSSSAADKVPSGGKDFLWRVSSPGATGYLLGSVHVLDSTTYRSDADFERAFQEAQIVVFETDLDQLDSEKIQQTLLTRGSYPGGETLQQNLPKDLYSRVEKAARELGLPPEGFNRFRPWFCALTLANAKLLSLGFNPEKGVDRYFYEKARASGKQIIGLETPADQVDLFAGMPPEAQKKFLVQSLKDLKNAKIQLEEIIAAWEAGDSGKLESLFLQGLREDPVLYRRLVVQRNQEWMKPLENLLAGNKTFLMVVGAAHLAGPDGLVSLLRSRGFKVEQF